MNAIERLAALFHAARMAGGWDDEAVARAALAELGLDDDGLSAQPPAPPPSLEA
jgi:hypothetical protein